MVHITEILQDYHDADFTGKYGYTISNTKIISHKL